ncbi:unnamed protein product [Darwinula stevensoni]|uniref:Uncharacterized protein n=1 Tax=Darwinula stevensoni TaxID=69355 RepID=A0A7R8X8Z9_9CRUS|nr:unnamed protein product [Darwinula stevensoni]CAG0890603.1 unnamed protein product [Darwinula stevensoni]
MCPFFPFHYIILYVCLLGPLWLLSSHVSAKGPVGVSSRSKNLHQQWNITFFPSEVERLEEDQERNVSMYTLDLDWWDKNKPLSVMVETDDFSIAEVSGKTEFPLNTTQEFNFTFSLKGKFLGFTFVRVKAQQGGKTVQENKELRVEVIRRASVLDTIFTYSIIIIVSIAYINMGSTLDLKIIWNTIRRPWGPVVGICSQYLFMPLVAFGLSQGLLSEPSLQLSLFVTGCSPGGGASNIWTVLLNGNMNLSITMTFISTVVAFLAMPAWLFSLGRVIFEEGQLVIPYRNIGTLAIGLVIPVAIGIMIRRFWPRAAEWLLKILRPFSILIIIYILTFGIYANYYVFLLLSWRIVVSCIVLIWSGFAFGALVSYLCKFPVGDIIAIAVETGIQNTGVAIVLLRFSLPQPEADLTLVIPAMAAMMMPIPLTGVYVVQKIMRRKEGSMIVSRCESPSGKELVQHAANGEFKSPDQVHV